MTKLKLKAFVALMALTMMFTLLTTNSTLESQPAKAYVGIAYHLSKKGASAEKAAGIGVLGVAHAAWEGFIWGAAFGGGVGAVAGVVVGL